ncbi:hypothetical protein QVD17_20620 [Tagetes erecta]|uniref:60S acidic ribosomal protein P2 n=1 Tax=Tagetes erecta TaxID=13708 RepID=A0AAD8KQ06_TARER|nr:hypothetical protein QVD17_20620 [Tagetes erecta]
MGSNTEPDPYTTLKLPLFTTTNPYISDYSGTATPPPHTTASVPFRWEEQPGKPRPCTDIIIAPTYTTKCLELPPRLTVIQSIKVTKNSSSPTTVLDGPGGKSVFSSSSFRFAKERRRRCKGNMQGSFDSSCSGGWSPNDVVSFDDKNGHRKLYGLKSKSCKGKGGDHDGGVVSSPSWSSTETGFLDEKKKRNRSLSKVTRSQFWFLNTPDETYSGSNTIHSIMKVVAAYLLALLGGNTSPSAEDLKSILASVEADADEDKIELLLSEVKGKDITELIASGREKLASVPSGGGVAVAAAVGGGAPAAAAAEAKKEEKEEEKEVSDDDMGFSLFD